jgi:hypothetical protein
MENVKKQLQKIPYLILCLLLICVTAYAQDRIKVTGSVFDSKGETIIGANVTLKGNSSIGTITDIDGNFVLSVPRNSVLVISYIGMKKKKSKLLIIRS